jgi:hypothetical protein
LGFLLSTFFLLLFLFRMLEPQRWRVVILMTVLTVTLCYVLFGVFLELRFPGGLLGRMIDLLN